MVGQEAGGGKLLRYVLNIGQVRGGGIAETQQAFVLKPIEQSRLKTR